VGKRTVVSILINSHGSCVVGILFVPADDLVQKFRRTLRPFPEPLNWMSDVFCHHDKSLRRTIEEAFQKKKKKKKWDAENRRELVGDFGALNEKKVLKFGYGKAVN
jgi:hypothetical protein